jgi:hypothetical protein
MSSRLFPERRVLWMPIDFDWQPPSPGAIHCCPAMALALEHTCKQHDDPFDCPDVALVFHEPFGEYGIPIRDGSASYLLISHCPWCGAALPASARDRWFDEVEAAGLDGAEVSQLPARFLSAAWRTKPTS